MTYMVPWLSLVQMCPEVSWSPCPPIPLISTQVQRPASLHGCLNRRLVYLHPVGPSFVWESIHPGHETLRSGLSQVLTSFPIKTHIWDSGLFWPSVLGFPVKSWGGWFCCFGTVMAYPGGTAGQNVKEQGGSQGCTILSKAMPSRIYERTTRPCLLKVQFLPNSIIPRAKPLAHQLWGPT